MSIINIHNSFQNDRESMYNRIFLICRRTIMEIVCGGGSMGVMCVAYVVMKFSFIFILIMYLFLFQRDLIYYFYNAFKDLFTALILCFHKPRECGKLFVLSTIEVILIVILRNVIPLQSLLRSHALSLIFSSPCIVYFPIDSNISLPKLRHTHFLN